MNTHPTKERILEAAEGLMLEKSFHSVGLNEILAAVKMPKGSFYHHFESKEQFGVELLKHYVAGATAYKAKLLLASESEPDPLLRLLTYFEVIVAKVMANEGKCPCLVVKLASEVADFSEPMREVLAKGNNDWATTLEKVLREGMDKGKIAEGVNPAEFAVTIQDLWTGAMQRSAIARSAAPLRAAICYIRARLSP